MSIRPHGCFRWSSAEIRVHACAPLFKLYILNDSDAFFGFYPIYEHTLTLNGSRQAIFDLMGKDALLFHHSASQAAGSSAYVEQAQMWFDSMWNTISREHTP